MVSYSSACRALFDLLSSVAEFEKDDVVLDVGCGFGDSTVALAELCERVIGVNDNAAEVDGANARLVGVANAKVVKSSGVSVRELEGANGVTKVFALDCVYHFPRRKFFEACGAISSVKGVYFTDIVLKRRAVSLFDRVVAHSVSRLTASDSTLDAAMLVQELREAGFSSVTVDSPPEGFTVMGGFATFLPRHRARVTAELGEVVQPDVWSRLEAAASFMGSVMEDRYEFVVVKAER
jgi:cyclopropane fatty-acyl-phospholipid synthase-like methyltransferase